MLLGPLFVAEFTTAGRRRRYFWLRALYALTLLLFLWARYETHPRFLSSVSTIADAARLAGDFFMAFTGVQVLGIYLIVPAMMAGAIAQERERRTIEYLLTSQLSASDIILGKFGARLSQTAILLLSGFGVFAVLQLMGGVAARELVWAVGGSFVLMVEVGGLSLLISTWTKRSRDALRNTYIVLFAWSILPVWLSEMTSVNGSMFMQLTVALTPWSVLSSAFDYQAGSSPFALAMVHLMLGIGYVAAAIVSLRPAYRRQTAVRGDTPLQRVKTAWRRRAIGDRPMRWKETRSSRAGFWLTLTLAIAGGLTSFFMYVSYSHYRVPGDLIFFLVAPMSFSLILIGVRAAAIITSEKERECWPILISTTLPADEIIFEKALGAVWSARPLVAFNAVAIISCLLFFDGAIKYVLAMMVMYAAFAAFCAMLGVRLSLSSRDSISAIGKTMTVLFVINVAFYGLAFLIFSTNTLSEGNWIWILSPCIPFAIAFVGDTLFETSSRYVVSTMLSIIVSIAVYSFAAAWLFAACRNGFDRLTGRTLPNRW